MSLKKNIYALQQWYLSHARSLPWRDSPTPYRVWVSEIMLQQTQVAAVIPFFDRFIERFPDLSSLAKAEEAEVLKYWAGLGYYSRARNLHKAARFLFANGGFPTDRDELIKLPGIGPYTAGAILSIAFEQPVPILDANVERIISRIRAVQGEDFKSRLWKYSRIVVQTAYRMEISPSEINQAMMELGALICQKIPRCEICPLLKACRSFQRNSQDQFPPRPIKKKWLDIKETVLCMLDNEDRLLMRRTPPGAWRAGLWDLPIPEEIRCQGILVGEVSSQSIVTNHKINRLTRIFRDQGSVALLTTEWAWFHLDDLLHPDKTPGIGTAIKKSLPLIRDKLISNS